MVGKTNTLANEKAPIETGRRFAFSLRAVLYGICFFLTFAATVAELGLVSQQLHKYGNTYDNYASKDYKNALGLLLFAVLISLMFTLSHPWLGVGLAAFTSFIIALFFGTGAGIIQRTTPFQGHSCGKSADSYPKEWQRYAGECGRIVAIQGLALALWALYIFLMVGTLIQKLHIRTRPTPELFYYAKP